MGMLGHEEVSTLTTVTGWERVLLGLNSQSLTVDSDCRAGINDHHVLGFHRCHLLASSQWQTELGVATPSYRWGNWGSEAIIYPRRRAELKFKIGPQATHLVLPRPPWETFWNKNGTLSLESRTLCPGRSWWESRKEKGWTENVKRYASWNMQYISCGSSAEWVGTTKELKKGHWN